MPHIDPITMSPQAGGKPPSTGSAAVGTSSPSKSKKLEATCPPSSSTPSSWTTATPSDNLSPLASYVSVSIPALQLQLFVFFFRQLVDDPVATMGQAHLPVMAAIQILYAVAFLPIAGSAPRSQRKLRPGEKKRAGGAASGEPNVAVATLLSLLLTLFATPPLHATMVLFGAPFLTHTSHTFLCALHLSLLAFFPLFYTRGVDAGAWRALASLSSPLDENVGALVGACLGAWLGAVPIPLDWDRDWQRWPVTVLAGIYVGHAIGSYAGRTVLKGRRF